MESSFDHDVDLIIYCFKEYKVGKVGHNTQNHILCSCSKVMFSLVPVLDLSSAREGRGGEFSMYSVVNFQARNAGIMNRSENHRKASVDSNGGRQGIHHLDPSLETQ